MNGRVSGSPGWFYTNSPPPGRKMLLRWWWISQQKTPGVLPVSTPVQRRSGRSSKKAWIRTRQSGTSLCLNSRKILGHLLRKNYAEKLSRRIISSHDFPKSAFCCGDIFVLANLAYRGYRCCIEIPLQSRHLCWRCHENGCDRVRLIRSATGWSQVLQGTPKSWSKNLKSSFRKVSLYFRTWDGIKEGTGKIQERLTPAGQTKGVKPNGPVQLCWRISYRSERSIKGYSSPFPGLGDGVCSNTPGRSRTI